MRLSPVSRSRAPAAHALRSQPSSRRLSIRLQRTAASENLNYRIAVLEDSPLLVGSLPANHSDAILRSAKGEINASEAELGAAVAGLAGLAGLTRGRSIGQDAARRESIDLGCGLNMSAAWRGLRSDAGVVKLADARDSKSRGVYAP